MRVPFVFLTVVWFGVAPVMAQSTGPAPAAEVTAGYAGFLDSPIIGHTLLGAAMRFHLSPRISIGPEVQYMTYYRISGTVGIALPR
jgi:hypothetical protein